MTISIDVTEVAAEKGVEGMTTSIEGKAVCALIEHNEPIYLYTIFNYFNLFNSSFIIHLIHYI